MKTAQIEVRNLTKTYRVPIRPEGLKASIKSLLKPTYNEVTAVRDVSFSIETGSIVGLIGPNGAGKTTTLKILSGLLHPSNGEVKIGGYIPWQRRPEHLRRISMVMGNKSQMLWDIPPLDSFRVLGEIYDVPKAEFQDNLNELIHMLEMKDILTKPVRNLSLGERMKCELTASLLYKPEVLFLDEPTLGLDVSTQLRLRKFLADYNQRCGTTIILTSHYMADVMALCPRVILIHQGRLMYDGELGELARKLIPYKMLHITLSQDLPSPFSSLHLGHEIEVTEDDSNGYTLRVPRLDAPAVTARLLQNLPVADLTVEDPPIEAVIDLIYSEGVQ